MRVALPPTRRSMDLRLAVAAAVYVTAQFTLTGFTLVSPPATMAFFWVSFGILGGFGMLLFEMVKLRRAGREP